MTQCSYWWQEEDENNPSCHYTGPDSWAPCAQDERIVCVQNEGIVTDYDGNRIQTAEEAVNIMDAYLEASGNPYI